ELQTNMRKLFTTLKTITLALTVLLIFGSMSKFPIAAKMEPGSSRISLQSAATLTSRTTTSTMQTSGMDMSTVNIYALTNDNTIYVVTNSSTGLQFKRLVRPAVSGNLVGLDFLASDGNSNIVYGLTDLGKLYKIDLSPTNLGAATLLSTLNPQFAG